MKILHDQDADVAMLSGKTVAVIGYGNQGAAQALCMRDSGVKVIIGSIKDASYDKAIQDGFEVLPIAEAAARAGHRAHAAAGRISRPRLRQGYRPRT